MRRQVSLSLFPGVLELSRLGSSPWISVAARYFGRDLSAARRMLGPLPRTLRRALSELAGSENWDPTEKVRSSLTSRLLAERGERSRHAGEREPQLAQLYPAWRGTISGRGLRGPWSVMTACAAMRPKSALERGLLRE